MTAIAQSMTRVESQTAPEINERIRRQTQANIEYYADHPQEIPQRLAELDREWDMERMLQINSSILSLVGLALARKNFKWIGLPIAVQGFFLQHGLQGWCPPVPVFRRLGIRTGREIEVERHALKALRGDYEEATEHQREEALDAAGMNGPDRQTNTGGIVAPTQSRVTKNTEAAVNEQIEGAMERRIRFLERHEDARDVRLKELQGEWDIERTIEVEAPTMTLMGLALGITVSPKWLVVPVVAQTMMLLHSLQGFYPLLPLFRRMGLRTEDEIAKERYAIKAMRGDFQHVANARQGSEGTHATAEAAFEAAQ
jgi:hypothetical protein